MKNYIKWMIGVAALALFIGGAYFMYEKLADGNGGPQLEIITPDLENTTESNTQSNTESNTESNTQSNTEDAIGSTDDINDSSSESEEDSTEKEDTSKQETGNSEKESETSSETDTVIDYKAQDFTVVDQNGNNVKLSDMAGKIVVANFWATWCGYCKLEMPDFEEMYKKYGDDVVFMMINSGDIVEDAKAYVKSQGFTFPVYFDVYNEASIQYSVTSFPTTYFFSKDGAKVARAVGMISSETIEEGISMVTE